LVVVLIIISNHIIIFTSLFLLYEKWSSSNTNFIIP
jgi:hypothetical protein